METDTAASFKEPWLAVNLSMFLSGLGQLYAGRRSRGLILVILDLMLVMGVFWLFFSPSGNAGIGLLLLIPVALLRIWNLVDAHRCASGQRHDKDPWLAVFLSRIFPGIGHIYTGRVGLGVVFIIVLIALSLFVPDPAGNILLSMWCAFACYHVFRRYRKTPGISPRYIMVIAGLIILLAIPLQILRGSYRALRIPTSSMEPTFRVGDYILVRTSSGYEAERGDVVVFREPSTEKQYIKRVVALGGESISMKGGKIYVDGAELKLKPFDDIPASDISRDPLLANFSWDVPPRTVFLLGDSIWNSFDSRHYGPVSIQRVFGKVIKIYWPLGHAKPIR